MREKIVKIYEEWSEELHFCKGAIIVLIGFIISTTIQSNFRLIGLKEHLTNPYFFTSIIIMLIGFYLWIKAIKTGFYDIEHNSC